ncbi:unnamed protein product [Closterium sp. NIES-64]|nr:unnamed protein product [Closterium sp. NIES-64]
MELIMTGRGVTEEEAAAGRASCVALRHALQQQLRQAGAEAFIAPAATGFPPPLHQGVGNKGDLSKHDRRPHHGHPLEPLRSVHCHHASRPVRFDQASSVAPILSRIPPSPPGTTGDPIISIPWSLAGLPTVTMPVALSTTGDPIMSIPWSHAGLPTVTLPVALAPAAAAGSTREGGSVHECSEESNEECSREGSREYLPLGVTLVGMWNEDETLLDVALELEGFSDCTSPL